MSDRCPWATCFLLGGPTVFRVFVSPPEGNFSATRREFYYLGLSFCILVGVGLTTNPDNYKRIGMPVIFDLLIKSFQNQAVSNQNSILLVESLER